MDTKKHFSQNLSYLMEEENLSNRQLGRSLKIGASTINQWKNQQTLPNLKNSVKLADFFHTSVDFLFGLTEERYFFAESPVSFPDRLNEIMTELNIRKKTILSKCFLGNSTFTKWNNGHLSNLDNLTSIAVYLNFPIEYLIGRTDKTVL